MRHYLLAMVLVIIASLSQAQDFKVSVVNDTTELHEYDNGQKIKVIYRLNSRILSIKEKEQLIGEYPDIHRDFNIRNENNETIGEVNFSSEGDDRKLKYDKPAEQIRPTSIDILNTQKGALFPSFSWTILDKKNISLEDLKGKTVVLNFWHTSCIPCVAEMPLLNKLVSQYAKENVVFISTTPNTLSELKQFLEKREFVYQQVPAIDPKSIFSPFPGWPIHVVLNGEGKIQFMTLGKQNAIEEKLRNGIEESLQQTIHH